MELAIPRPIPAPFCDKRASSVELLDAVVIRICDVNVPFVIDPHTKGMIELAIRRSTTFTPFRDKRASSVELLDAVIIGICNVHVPYIID